MENRYPCCDKCGREADGEVYCGDCMADVGARVRELEERFRGWMGALVELAWAHDVALYEDRPGAFVDVLRGRISAERAKAVREFAAQMDAEGSDCTTHDAENFLANLARKEG
jgi:hypothetical protein